jgi:Domain of unknown function (DUF4402)
VSFRKYLMAAALAAAAVPAAAAPVDADQDADARALILMPLTLTKIEDLDFGAVVPSPVSGFVSINATTGARTTGGGVTGVPSAVGQRAYFAGAGSANQLVFVSVTPPAELVSTSDPSDTIMVLAMPLQGSALKTIHPVTRSFFFGVGGIIMIGANQPEGIYEATFDVTASYQ